MVAALAVIGLLDFVSGSEIRLLPFYAGPVFVVAWFCEKRTGIIVSLLAGAIWWFSNWLAGAPELHGWMQMWEACRHTGSFLVVALVGSALRSKSDIAAARIALLERSQGLEREIVNISDAEQRRIGQDLHDGLCQYLAAVACSATALREDLDKLGLRAETNAAADLADLLQEAVVQARDLARELVPAHVAQVGLVLALEWLVQSVTRLQRVNCTFQHRGVPVNYDAQTAGNLYRIAQEAINNATKHGKAKNVAVSLIASEDVTTLRIWDDGVGFSRTKPNGSGMGLNIMRYRARLSGGELKIEQPPSGGTQIWCTARTTSSEASQNQSA
jgi:signal transduction histidine kinase